MKSEPHNMHVDIDNPRSISEANAPLSRKSNSVFVVAVDGIWMFWQYWAIAPYILVSESLEEHVECHTSPVNNM